MKLLRIAGIFVPVVVELIFGTQTSLTSATPKPPMYRLGSTSLEDLRKLQACFSFSASCLQIERHLYER